MPPTTSRAASAAAARPAEQGLALEEQRERAEAEEQRAGAEGRTPTGRRLPRAELVLDHVGHRLDDVVVDARGLVVDAGGDGEQAAVLDALDGQAGVAGELASVLGDEAVAAVDGGRVQDADAARQLGDELGHRDGTGEDEVDPS